MSLLDCKRYPLNIGVIYCLGKLYDKFTCYNKKEKKRGTIK